MNTRVAFLQFSSLLLSFKTNADTCHIPEVREDGLGDLNMPIVAQTFIIPLKVFFSL